MPIYDPKAFAAEIVAKNAKKKTPGPEKKPAGGEFARPPLDAPGDPGEGAYEPEGEAPEGEQAAVSSMMMALEKKDSSGFAKGLKAYIEICFPQLARDRDEDA